jgi:hypothetical protein
LLILPSPPPLPDRTFSNVGPDVSIDYSEVEKEVKAMAKGEVSDGS